MTSGNRVGHWGKFYASKLNPWNIKDARDELKDLVVPSTVSRSGFVALSNRLELISGFSPISQITFIPLQDLNLDPPPQQIFPRERPSFDPLLAVSTPLTSFFFRNLTSFIISPGFRLDGKFVAALFAPTQSLCTTLVSLDLSGAGLDTVAVFVLGAFVRFEFEMDWGDPEWDVYEDREDERLAYWERYCDRTRLDDEAEAEPEWLWDGDSPQAIERKLISQAPTDFETFRKLFAYVLEIHDPAYLQGCTPKLYAFSNLESLNVIDPHDLIIQLLFAQALCYPSLGRIKLLGMFAVDGEGTYWVPYWRLAITNRVLVLQPISLPRHLLTHYLL